MTASAHALNHEIIDDLKTILGDGFDEIIDEQVEQAAIYLSELQQQLGRNQPQEVVRLAHSLKSSAGQIGLHGIHALAKELEAVSIADSEGGACSLQATELFRTIVEEMPSAVQGLRRYLT